MVFFELMDVALKSGWAAKATTYYKIIIPHVNQTKYYRTSQ